MSRKIRMLLACVGLAVAASIFAAATVGAAGAPASAAALAPAGASHAGKAHSVVTRLSTASAKPGASLTITGRGFGAKRGKGTVLFGAFKAVKYLRWSATRIVCKVPVIPAGKMRLRVRTAGGTAGARTSR